MAQHFLRRVLIFLMIQSVLAAEVRNPALRRNTRSAEENDIVASAHKICQLLYLFLFRHDPPPSVLQPGRIGRPRPRLPKRLQIQQSCTLPCSFLSSLLSSEQEISSSIVLQRRGQVGSIRNFNKSPCQHLLRHRIRTPFSLSPESRISPGMLRWLPFLHRRPV